MIKMTFKNEFDTEVDVKCRKRNEVQEDKSVVGMVDLGIESHRSASTWTITEKEAERIHEALAHELGKET
jgi:hypothetical protein